MIWVIKSGWIWLLLRELVWTIDRHSEWERVTCAYLHSPGIWRRRSELRFGVPSTPHIMLVDSVTASWGHTLQPSWARTFLLRTHIYIYDLPRHILNNDEGVTPPMNMFVLQSSHTNTNLPAKLCATYLLTASATTVCNTQYTTRCLHISLRHLPRLKSPHVRSTSIPNNN